MGGKAKACFFCAYPDRGVATFEIRRLGEDRVRKIRAHHRCVRKERRRNPNLLVRAVAPSRIETHEAGLNVKSLFR